MPSVVAWRPYVAEVLHVHFLDTTPARTPGALRGCRHD
jgi:hypothetical protein